MYGYAVGVVRLTSDEFRQMTVDEFDAVAKAYRESRESEYHDGWERMRVLASICVQPHVRKKVTPKELLKFPWDDKPREKKPIPTKEEAMKEYNALMERLKNG